VFRLIEVLQYHGLRGTVALNSEVCDAYPAIIDEAVRLRWEFMGHNQSNTRRLNEIEPENEHAVVTGTCERIAEATGRRPAGWLSSGLQETWNTLDHLVDAGCIYVSDWVNDDQPYLMDVGGKRLVSMPYSAEINDKPAFETLHVTPDEFAGMIRRQFDVLYRESVQSSRVMAIALHPYIIGVPHRIDALDLALRHICRYDDVWLATGEEIARHYLTTIER
jgi:allantoinase